ncbi:uncharacterized protein V1510DRAFT_407433 [Dipodascopsis tothii]|uniref:uncharacterized protein n=1 Tax=Dipodascopsis tothii TaxID=44089 RepID=UPI0034CD2FB8
MSNSDIVSAINTLITAYRHKAGTVDWRLVGQDLHIDKDCARMRVQRLLKKWPDTDMFLVEEKLAQSKLTTHGGDRIHDEPSPPDVRPAQIPHPYRHRRPGHHHSRHADSYRERSASVSSSSSSSSSSSYYHRRGSAGSDVDSAATTLTSHSVGSAPTDGEYGEYYRMHSKPLYVPHSGHSGHGHHHGHAHHTAHSGHALPPHTAHSTTHVPASAPPAAAPAPSYYTYGPTSVGYNTAPAPAPVPSAAYYGSNIATAGPVASTPSVVAATQYVPRQAAPPPLGQPDLFAAPAPASTTVYSRSPPAGSGVGRSRSRSRSPPRKTSAAGDVMRIDKIVCD